MKIEITKLKEVLKNIALKYVSEDEAVYFANEISESYIRKYPRWNILKDGVISDAKRQEKYNKNEPKIIKELPSLIRIDFNHLPITFRIKYLHDILKEKARSTGIAMLAFDNSGGMHSLHTWAQGLAKQDLFVIGAYNGGPPSVVPTNGTEGLLGTNPITFGFPTKEGNVVVDMATSQIPFFEIAQNKKNNTLLKDDVAVNKAGELTTDPNQALFDNGVANLVPMGNNYKGYAINYLIEIMTATLIEAKLSPKQDLSYVDEDHGGFIMTINISAFTDLEKFKEEVSDFNSLIRSQTPAQGKKVIVPGDNNRKKYEDAVESGVVNVDEEIWDQVLELLD